jgi:hypothetical protein
VFTLEAPIKTEAEVLAENHVLHSSPPKSPKQNVQTTGRTVSRSKWENQRNGLRKISLKRKKSHCHPLFEPRTHHPYLLEMVRGFCSCCVLKVGSLGCCVCVCVCFQATCVLCARLAPKAAFGIYLVLSTCRTSFHHCLTPVY